MVVESMIGTMIPLKGNKKMNFWLENNPKLPKFPKFHSFSPYDLLKNPNQ